MVSKPTSLCIEVSHELTGHRVKEASPVSEEVKTRYMTAGFADLEVHGKSADDWYCLLRKVQGTDALPHILDGTLGHQVDYTDFEQDTLMCEWTYFVDWEKKKLYVGGGDAGGRAEDRAKGFEELSVGWMESLEVKE